MSVKLYLSCSLVGMYLAKWVSQTTIIVGHYFSFIEADKRNEEKAKLQDEKTKLAKKVDELEDQVQQHNTHLSSLVPAQG